MLINQANFRKVPWVRISELLTRLENQDNEALWQLWQKFFCLHLNCFNGGRFPLAPVAIGNQAPERLHWTDYLCRDNADFNSPAIRQGIATGELWVLAEWVKGVWGLLEKGIDRVSAEVHKHPGNKCEWEDYALGACYVIAADLLQVVVCYRDKWPVPIAEIIPAELLVPT